MHRLVLFFYEVNAGYTADHGHYPAYKKNNVIGPAQGNFFTVSFASHCKGRN
jgi:hypothetical protein